MFGHNEVIGRKFFTSSPESVAGKLLVTSIFFTIQGEGPLAGRPAVFVRLAKCQLQCSFCDTYFDSGDWMTPAEVREKAIMACADAPVPSLMVVTGGEPTLQNDALHALLSRGSAFPETQIETNGMLEPTVPYETVVVVSPKCVEVGGAPTRYYGPNLRAIARANCLKFVVCADADSPYYSIPSWALEWRERTGRDVYVSPMAQYNHAPGMTQKIYDARRDPSMVERTAAERVSFWEPNLLDMQTCRRNYEYAAEYVLRHNLRLSIQQHLFAGLS
jgi:organic radical activating enzyme